MAEPTNIQLSGEPEVWFSPGGGEAYRVDTSAGRAALVEDARESAIALGLLRFVLDEIDKSRIERSIGISYITEQADCDECNRGSR